LIFNQLSDAIATRVAEINALKAQGSRYGLCCPMRISKRVA
jgi:hypothetical protein